MSDQEPSETPSEGTESAAVSGGEEGLGEPNSLVNDMDSDANAVEALGKFYANRVQNFVLNNFSGSSTVGTAGIGQSGRDGLGVQRDDGPLDDAKLDRRLHFYLKPGSFKHALKKLEEKRFVILLGPEGTGRALGSLKLAVEVGERGVGVTRQPPTRSLAELTAKAKGYQAGQVYVIHDWAMVNEVSQAELGYDADQLSAGLIERGAYMILTAGNGRGAYNALAGYLVAWEAPDPAALFDHCLERSPEHGISDAECSLLRSRAQVMETPRRVVEFVEYAVAHGAGEALTAVGDDDAERVRDWLKSSDRGGVRLAAALVFVGGLPRRRFEDSYAQLAAIQASLEPAQEDPDAKPPDDASPFPQQRRALMDGNGIGQFLTVPPRVPGAAARHRPEFRAAGLRELFLAELLDNYDDKLWRPIRLWLDTATELPFGDEHAAIAGAIALLARLSVEDAHAYLDAWAAGPVSKRLTVSYVLWRMALDDATAPTALYWAVS